MPFQARVWDCSKFAVLWLRTFAPKSAAGAVALLVAAGYNDADSDAAQKELYGKLGVSTADGLADYIVRGIPGHAEQPVSPEPGDIAIRGSDLSFGIVDEDFQAMFLDRPTGYLKQALGSGDAVVRFKG